MESFVIRIYRRADAGQPTLVGTLESVASGERRAFHSRSELLTMLDSDIVRVKPAARRVVAAKPVTGVVNGADK